ncbi:AI-2E family transporter [Fortiea contorta]|uniref:AI-2E family transporter n=1 Tax=Fortiea contorta TaxID=1892405 RepID=UPI0003656520|nr:AI-2E family transporter [Fortiea contorta]
MNIPLNQLLKWLILTLLFPAIFLNGWLVFKLFHYFQPLVTILVLAALFAFILNYPVSGLEKRGFKRNYAVALVFIFSLVVLLALGIVVLPIILEQFQEMAKLLPQWIDSSVKEIHIFNNWASNYGLKVNFGEIFTQITNRLPNEFEYFSDKIFSVVIDTIDSISEGLVTVVLTFYLLLDGAKIWELISQKLPWRLSLQVSKSIQQNFQNYLIGQVSLALLMGVSQTLMFLAFQVHFALLFGLGVGLLSLIPFGDVISLIVIIFILATHDFWLAVKIFVAAVIIDQLIDQAIAPRILGKITGIRPIWVIISLLIGTYIGGLLGLLIAVPIAGVIKDAVEGFAAVAEYPDTVVAQEVTQLLAEE